MTIRFAAAVPNRSPRLSRAAARAALRLPANDNSTAEAQARLEATLRHFARHGLAAARTARSRAEEAFFAGDRAGYDRWLDICRMLDSRMAEDVRDIVMASGESTPACKVLPLQGC